MTYRLRFLIAESADHQLQEHCRLTENHCAFLLVVGAIRQLEYQILDYPVIRQMMIGHDVFDDRRHSRLLHLQRHPQ
jgi:hypothetical protein